MVMEKAFGDKYNPSLGMKLIKPPRFPNAPDGTTSEEQIEWLRSEFAELGFEQLSKKYDESKESKIRMKDRIEQGCQEINDLMKKSGENLDREVTMSLRRAKEITEIAEAKLEHFEQFIRSKEDIYKEMMSEAVEMYNRTRKFNEELFNKHLENEREIDAIEEAIKSGTFEIKVEKSYKCGLVPRWTRPSLSKTSYTVAPVYRTIEGFEQKKKNNERITTEPFYKGYKLTLRVYPNGHGLHQGSHVSIYIHLMKGENDNKLNFPFTGTVIVQVLNWAEDDEHFEYIIQFNESIPLTSRERVTSNSDGGLGSARGTYGYLSLRKLEKYLHNDMMCFRVSVEPITQTGLLPVPSWYTSDITSSIPPCTITMDQYSLFKKTWWCSRPFFSSERGYKLQLLVYGMRNRSGVGAHLSVYVRLLKGEYDEQLKWPFNANITIQLLNWTHDSNHIEKTISHHQAPVEKRERVIDGYRAPGIHGGDQFIPHSDLNNDSNGIQYINDDNLCFRIISVDIID